MIFFSKSNNPFLLKKKRVGGRVLILDCVRGYEMNSSGKIDSDLHKNMFRAHKEILKSFFYMRTKMINENKPISEYFVSGATKFVPIESTRKDFMYTEFCDLGCVEVNQISNVNFLNYCLSLITDPFEHLDSFELIDEEKGLVLGNIAMKSSAYGFSISDTNVAFALYAIYSKKSCDFAEINREITNMLANTLHLDFPALNADKKYEEALLCIEKATSEFEEKNS